MSKKIGDVALVLVILTFVIGAFSGFINSADETTGLDSGIIAESFNEFDDSLDGVVDLENEYTDKVDSSSEMAVEDPDAQLEQRGSDSAGVLNIFSKNILVRFLTKVSEKIPGAGKVIAFISSLIAITITILTVRFIWGDSRI